MGKSAWIAIGMLTLGGIVVGSWAVLRPHPERPLAVKPPVEARPPIPDNTTNTIERTDYTPPIEPGDGLTDDKLADKMPEFDPFVQDPRPIGDWRLNLSGAVIALDVPMVYPDLEPKLGDLYPSYAAAIVATATRAPMLPSISRTPILPSVNLIDGKAKQFDDGLVAALELARFRGLDGVFPARIGMIERLLAKVGLASPAAPFLAASLELAGKPVAVKATQEKDRWVADFLADETRSKPVGFHAWSPELTRAFQFQRFLQTPFDSNDLAIPRALARAVASDPTLLADFQHDWTFAEQLANPSRLRSFVSLIGHDEPQPATVGFSLMSVPSSRELELFGRLFPTGLPTDANLIRELVVKIRSGSVDLRPRDNGGWLDSQVFALETLLVPDRGDEHDRLLLTRSYKRRMLDAFQALMTKRLETHSLMPAPSEAPYTEPLIDVAPRLRLEPCPSFYLRTARAYSFLDDFLRASIGEAGLKRIHGLREGGERPLNLWTDLGTIRELFYGFYLISAEDIGMTPTCLDPDGVDVDRARTVAIQWLESYRTDPDLAVDTRVSVPVYGDPGRGVTRLWTTLGVRLAKLDASYARPPQARPANGRGDWRPVEPGSLETSHYLIAVDEVAEVELKGLRVLTWAELRKVCDEARTRAAIVRALSR